MSVMTNILIYFTNQKWGCHKQSKILSPYFYHNEIVINILLLCNNGISIIILPLFRNNGVAINILPLRNNGIAIIILPFS